MIGLDSNVIIRYLAQDDAIQSPVATRLLESFNSETVGFVSVVALIETVGVLRSFYDASRQQIQGVVEALLRSKGLVVEHSDLAWIAIRAYAQGKADFSDYLIECHSRAAGCEYTVTFDRDAASSGGMKLLK
jgi:predicted nucleic-acid-binding protein